MQVQWKLSHVKRNDMSKNNKVVSMKPAKLNPENYIKTNARILPIGNCWLNNDWQDTGLAHIIVERLHKTGNITFGTYLVDLYCLGLRDTYYEFNTDPDDYEDEKNIVSTLEKCDYTLVHNIIYGAIAYAEDYGFKPHKDFSISKFILEEDDDDIELMELEFGLSGKPCYIIGANDNEAKIKQVIATLTRTAGEGNFEVREEDDLDEEFLLDRMFDEEPIDELGLDSHFASEYQKQTQRYLKIYKKISKVYDDYIRTAEVKAIIKQTPRIGDGYKISKDCKDQHDFDNQEQEKEYEFLTKLVLEEEDYDMAIKVAYEALDKYPGQPAFYNILNFAYTFMEEYERAENIILEACTRYPDYLYTRVHYANLLLSSGREEEILQVFNGKPDLDALYPDRKVFHPGEAAAFYGIMCRYFIATDNIDSADLYADAMFRFKLLDDYGSTVLRPAIEELCEAKMNKLTEATKDDADSDISG